MRRDRHIEKECAVAGLSKDASQLQFSDDGAQVFTGSYLDTVRVWD